VRGQDRGSPIQLLRSPWLEQFDALVCGASKSLTLCAPYVGRDPCDQVRSRVASNTENQIQLTILTDLSRDNILSGATDIAALAELADTWPETVFRFLPSLHAKVYVADSCRAVVTSSNLTDNGLTRNFEYGVFFSEAETAHAIEADVLDYARLGSPVDRQQLSHLASIVGDLRIMRQAAERSLRTAIGREFDRRLREVDEQLFRVRAAGRSAHAIFSDAILHLLRRRPMSTIDLNRAIQQIHPDLCDDSVDRVIDGQHFGKKWKHGVRTAQATLRRRGEVRLEGKLWRLAD